MAEKHKKINWKKVDGYLKAGCSGREISAQLGIHENTLYMRCKEEKNMDFVAYKQEKQSAGDALLKAVQFEEAITNRDRGMLIWLGKQRLGQKDKIDNTNKNLNLDVNPDNALNLEDIDKDQRALLCKIFNVEDEFNGDHIKSTE